MAAAGEMCGSKPLAEAVTRSTGTGPFWSPGVLDKAVEIEFLDDTPALEADFRTPLFEAIDNVVQEYDSRATLLPYLVVGATDARHVTKMGTKVYGFSPMFAPTCELDRVHGHDERISIDNLAFGTRTLYDVVSRFCARS